MAAATTPERLPADARTSWLRSGRPLWVERSCCGYAVPFPDAHEYTVRLYSWGRYWLETLDNSTMCVTRSIYQVFPPNFLPKNGWMGSPSHTRKFRCVIRRSLRPCRCPARPRRCPRLPRRRPSRCCRWIGGLRTLRDPPPPAPCCCPATSALVMCQRAAGSRGWPGRAGGGRGDARTHCCIGT